MCLLLLLEFCFLQQQRKLTLVKGGLGSVNQVKETHRHRVVVFVVEKQL